ncbi:amidase [Ancylobacter sp. Lp-2]|uniref:amidase n=1 Tax=Ancylobacter sp. Lp-2 TaxID=2881339 RepID=UPI001E2AEB5B|nr:amidase [Ancylobacter sp. Lp-2]MCB4768473.1 amidase [Ancylobacter sp. Lp-2]
MSGSVSPRWLPVRVVARGIAEGSVRAAALVEEFTDAEHRLRHLNAFVRHDGEEAGAAAERAPEGPLGGVALAHKDMFHRDGRVTTCGSRLFAGVAAEGTATVLQRLDAAGALDLGTLHMAEFAHNSTGHNAFLGPARNPWNPAHITGGSSSGPGAAVAAGLVHGALGSDTGGSIRLPAHFCGVTGLKPTSGLVSRAGAMPLSFSLDTISPMARSAEDVAALLAPLVGTDPRDPTAEPAPGAHYVAACGAPVAGLRVGLPTAFYTDGLSPDVAEALEACARVLERLGVEIRPVELPDQDGLSAAQLVLVASEAASQHRERLFTDAPYDPQIRNRLLNGLGYSAQDYLQALRGRGAALAAHLAALDGFDAVLTPVAPFDAPTLAETDIGGGPDAEALIQSISRFMRPANYLGVPALAFPAGFSRRSLPVGLQLVGRPFGEPTLLALAAAYQRQTGHHRQIPPGV